MLDFAMHQSLVLDGSVKVLNVTKSVKACLLMNMSIWVIVRGKPPNKFGKKGVLKNMTNFTGKHLS